MAAPTLHDIYRVYLANPQDDGNVTYRLAGRFALHNEKLDILEDHAGLLARILPEGPVNPKTLRVIESLKHSAYMKVVSEHGMTAGHEPDLIKPVDAGEGVEPTPEPEAETKPPELPPGVFHYHRVGMDRPQILEAIDGKLLLNGNDLAPDEIDQVISNIESGNASLRYPKEPVENRVVKMEEALAELSKIEQEVAPALKELRAAVGAGHISPESLKAITKHMFVDSMVPGVGNRHAYRDFLSRAKKGVHIRIDANDFGGINKEHGFEAGDGAIRALGGVFRSSMDDAVGAKNGKLFRIGGDEFHAFVPSHEHAAQFLRHAKEQLGTIPPVGGTHSLSFSAGIGPSPFHAESSLMAAKRAKKSMAYVPGQAKTHIHSFEHGHVPLDVERPPLTAPKHEEGPTIADVATGMPPPKPEIPLQVEKSEKDGDFFLPQVQSALNDNLRKPKYKGNPNPMAGHCYVASEAVYHLLGGKRSGFIPQYILHEGEPHWFLRNKKTGKVLDPTAAQFKTPVPYEKGRGMGFLTAHPSMRARTVIESIKGKHGVKKTEPEGLHPPTEADKQPPVQPQPKLWYQDETSSSRFPTQNNPEFGNWHQKYLGVLKEYFGDNLHPVKIPVANAIPANIVHKPDRRDLYEQMIREKTPLPPVMARYNQDGSWQIIDGSHRLDAARRAGLDELDGYVEHSPTPASVAKNEINGRLDRAMS